jgi:WhiB family transcriptional regulator, redox-sensing transcriptional regulator
MLRGRCRGANPEIFDGGTGYDETAKGFCQRCEVRAECLEYALENSNLVIGVWGGLNEDERVARKRGGSRRSCPGCRGTSQYSDGVVQICISCGLTWTR